MFYINATFFIIWLFICLYLALKAVSFVLGLFDKKDEITSKPPIVKKTDKEIEEYMISVEQSAEQAIKHLHDYFGESKENLADGSLFKYIDVYHKNLSNKKIQASIMKSLERPLKKSRQKANVSEVEIKKVSLFKKTIKRKGVSQKYLSDKLNISQYDLGRALFGIQTKHNSTLIKSISVMRDVEIENIEIDNFISKFKTV